MGPYLQDSLSRKVIFFTGKGGVGKSTLCYATALALRREGKRPCVALWEPFDVTPGEHPLDPHAIPRMALDSLSCFRDYALQTVKFEKIYDTVFDNTILRTFIRTTPGVSDGVIAAKIEQLVQSDQFDPILVDLPSTGHTLSFFKSPQGIKRLFSVGTIRRQANRICELFESPQTRVDFVSLPEELPLTECELLVRELRKVMNLPYGFIFLNQLTPPFELETLTGLPDELEALRQIYLARQESEKAALESVRRLELPSISIPHDPSLQYSRIIESIAARLKAA